MISSQKNRCYILSTTISRWLVYVCLVALCCSHSQIIWAEETSTTPSTTIELRYNEAKFFLNQLTTHDGLAKKRSNWEKGAQNFRRIYLADPKSDKAAACLYMLGQIYHQIYLRFHTKGDLDESISYYSDSARLFHAHRLADDSYYALGQIYLIDKKDPPSAATQFVKIVQNYPNGDMHPHAADMMQQLSKEHDIALPKVMVGNSQATFNKLSYVLPVKYWSSDDYTRVVINASGPVTYKEELLQKTANKPRRLYIDFLESYIEPQYRAPVPIEDGLLQQIRTGQFSKNTVRVVLDIESIASYKIYSLPDPFRVVIDVKGKALKSKDTSKVAESSKIAAPLSTDESTQDKISSEITVLKDNKKVPPKNQDGVVKITRRSAPIVSPVSTASSSNSSQLSLAQQLGLGVNRIVLDPGHGGKDPGAMANGLKEKDIVLHLAKVLKPLLEEEIGCEVILTRDKDTFISLEERTAIANTENADLFISLHINAHPSTKVRGIETYYLNLSTNAEAMRVAAMENATSTHQISDLEDILADILKNTKINESSRLAQKVHTAIIAGLPEKEFGEVHNLGVKQAPFYVLIGAQMPAILIEIAFISNKDDADNLKSQQYISALAQEISTGIQSYVNSTTASLPTFLSQATTDLN